MNILGLAAFSHESTACLVQDGRVAAFIEEERLNRHKHTAVFPGEAIKLCLKMAGLKLRQIDQATFFWNPYLELTHNLKHLIKYFPRSLNLLLGPSGSDEFSSLGRIWAVLNLKRYFPHTPIYYCQHHLAHAATAYYPSGFKSAAILTLDGRGESTTLLMALGEGNRITKLREDKIPHSLGLLYSGVTDWLGFKAFSDEGKVMGLSSYGNRNLVKKFKRLVRFLPQGRIKLNLDYFQFHTHGRRQWLSKKFLNEFGPARKADEPITSYHKNMAKALQIVLEEGALYLVRQLYRLTKNPNLCLSGGVALNCLTNRRIIEETPFKRVFIPSMANDSGAALGSALYWYHQVKDELKRFPLKDVYLGPKFSDREILQVLKRRQLHYQKQADICATAAKLLSQGKIIGWFQGRMEAGPRALGNRSILADPRNPKMKDILNRRVKHREPFRPFAPSVLKEKSLDYFDYDNSPSMIVVAHVRPGKKHLVPSIVHVDNTVRLHTVEKNINPLYHRLITNFFKLTGIPVVLNTSFNDKEPIVCTPQHAVATFLQTDMDALAIGNYLVTK